MTEEEKKLLNIFKKQVENEEKDYFSYNAYTQLLVDSHKTVLNLIKKQQQELEKKNKQIDLMVKQLAELRENGEEDCFINQHINVCVTKYKTCEECIKQYFEQKVEEK